MPAKRHIKPLTEGGAPKGRIGAREAEAGKRFMAAIAALLMVDTYHMVRSSASSRCRPISFATIAALRRGAKPV